MDSHEYRGVHQGNSTTAPVEPNSTVVADALRACAPESNIGGWLAEIAVRFERAGRGVSIRTVESWLYGQAVPSVDSTLVLCGFLGKRFADALLSSTGLVTFRKDCAEASSAALALMSVKVSQTLRAIADEMERAK